MSLCPTCQISVPLGKNFDFQNIEIRTSSGKKVKPELPKNRVGCGMPGKPIILNLKNNHARLSKELKWDVDASGKMKWVCAYKILTTDCLEPLETAAAFADTLTKDGVDEYDCLRTLRHYNNRCSPFGKLDVFQRFDSVKESSRKVITELKKKKVPHSNIISPYLLVCTANRETAEFDPLEFNVTACRTRLKKQKRPNGFVSASGKSVMGNWVSTAFGLVNMVYNTFKGEWRKIENKEMLFPPTDNPTATYGQHFGSPDKMFKEMMTNPQLQMEMMARYLISVQNYPEIRDSASSDRLFHMVGYYDNRDAERYVNPVLNCAKCLGANPNNVNCLPHPPSSGAKK